MITYQKSPSWPRLAALIALCAAAGAVVWWWARPGDSVPSASPASSSALAGPAAAPFAPQTASATALPTMLEGRPADVNDEDWAALKKAMARVPGSQGQAERVVSYLHYQRSFETWQTLLDDARRQRERQQLAGDLLAQLPDRVAKGEFTRTEATLMATVLINDLEPNEAQRDQRLHAWLADLSRLAPQPVDETVGQQQDRMTHLRRREAVAFAEWQSGKGERDPAKLQQALEDAQRWYNSGEEP